MAQKKRRRKKLEPKYIFRRFLLVLILLGLLGGGGWYVFAKWQPFDKEPEPGPKEELENLAQPQGTQPDEPVDAPPEPVESEPETVPEKTDVGWNLLLVNGDNPLPEDFEVELRTVTDNFRVDERIADPLLRMLADARENGISLMICSAYRDTDLQETNFNNKVQEYMAAGMTEEEAIAQTSTLIAVPGTSEHHTGLAVDIVTPDYQTLDAGFADTPAFKWLQENAANYGFVMRFPADKERVTGITYEPWHYRYVGTNHASVMNSMSFCLEEYVSWLQDFRGSGLLEGDGTSEAPEEEDETGGEDPESGNEEEPVAE